MAPSAMFPDPFGGEPEPDLTSIDALIQEVELQAALLTEVATGGPSMATPAELVPGPPATAHRRAGRPRAAVPVPVAGPGAMVRILERKPPDVHQSPREGR
jgi:hypothetical protein